MVEPWVTILVAVVYVSILFGVASFGDRARMTTQGLDQRSARSRPNIYALSLAVYCTTWTFFGSVGLASTDGLSFLAIYLGPILAITFGFPLIRRVIELAKEERITSVADFLGSRYGKNLKVAAVAAFIAVIGTIPYIALQLKAISSSVDTLLVQFNNGLPSGAGRVGDIALFVSGALALFAILFGTRHSDATEHQYGLMLAIALESVVKLLAFLSVGIFVTWFMFDGVFDLANRAAGNEKIQSIINNGFDIGNFLILTGLSLVVFLLLPRQFHVAVVENNSLDELERARWLFPLYLVAINLFVVPIAVAGMLRFGIAANADDYVILLPILDGQLALGLLVFLGGLSAGMAMVVVACVALAIMISNDLVLPAILRMRAKAGRVETDNMEGRILNIRRTAIFLVMLLAYFYYRAADYSAALASIGLVSFAAIAQLAPAFFIGLFWRRGNARGAMFAMGTGFAVWSYCLLLPTLLPDNSAFVIEGPFGITALRPENLLGLDLLPLANGVVWSLLLNATAYFIASMTRQADWQERMQAAVFVGYDSPAARLGGVGNTHIRIAELMNTLSRYIGKTRTKRSIAEYWKTRGIAPDSNGQVDDDLLRYSEQLLASSIGASSSRLVHSLLLKRYEETVCSNYRLLDDASGALQFNRNVLQTAIDQLEQGITVFDEDFRLTSWNRQFRKILRLPSKLGQAGVPLQKIADEIVLQNKIIEFGASSEQFASKLVETEGNWHLNLPASNAVLEISASPMPQGGLVISWHNITNRVNAAKALKEVNETLEKRVEERTCELEAARQQADEANVSKTRFLAAAGHDILQPLNAARLYSATMLERSADAQHGDLATKISRSLSSVEEILGSILTISRLDTSGLDLDFQDFPLRAITEQLELEFDPIARQEGLKLVFVHSSKWVHSDRAQLRRLLQNLISNALKFTPKGKVLVGFRRCGNRLSMEVHDTGIGMMPEQHSMIFKEFSRLNNSVDQVPGLGLGLSIVARIAKLLDLELQLDSAAGRGTRFKVSLCPSTGIFPAQLQDNSKKRPRPGDLGGTKVLCIDNEASILEGMAKLLRLWGCTASTAQNLETAKQAIARAQSTPDVILIDFHLDNATGIEVLAALRKQYGDHIPGILITADRSSAMREMAKGLDIPIINKPVRPASMRALISRYQRKAEAAE